MLESTLLNHITILKDKYNLTPYQIKQLSLQLKYWKKNHRVYPGLIKSKLGIDIKNTYSILEYFRSANILERNFELYCSKCHKFKGKVVRALNDIPEDCSCDFCDNTFDPLKDTIVIYRVISNE